MSLHTPTKWTFTTIYEPMYGAHPVSGNRDFGYTVNPDNSYTFYTMVVDRLTSWDVSLAQRTLNIPFDRADAMWSNFQRGIEAFVRKNYGEATINSPQILRPNWSLLQEVMSGKKTLITFSKKCI